MAVVVRAVVVLVVMRAVVVAMVVAMRAVVVAVVVAVRAEPTGLAAALPLRKGVGEVIALLGSCAERRASPAGGARRTGRHVVR